MATGSPHCSLNFKISCKHLRNCGDNQQSKWTEAQTTEVLSTKKVSRRLVMELVGFNAVLLHVPPAHGASQVMGYSGATGPDNWGSMSPLFNSCSYGMAQSPIEIVKENLVLDQNLGPLSIGYNDGSATLVNRGFNVEMYYGSDVGGVTIDGKNYTLKQMHWHSPSEHTIDGVRYAAELHLVHISANGRISVVAILYKYGAPDPILSQISDQFDQLAKEASSVHKGASVPIELVRTRDIMKRTRKYFRYEGSLTTPPCSEKVIWNIIDEVREISKEQVAALKAPLDESCKNNSRPTQRLNGRRVKTSSAP